MINIKYSELLKKNREYAEVQTDDIYRIIVLSNIMTFQINDILEYWLRKERINAYVKSGNYDNIVQNAEKYSSANLIIIFWELSNLVQGLTYKINNYENSEISKLIDKVKLEIDLVFKYLQNVPLIIFNKFSSLIFDNKSIPGDNLNIICEELNEYLVKKSLDQVILIDLNKIISQCSIQSCIDWRFYYSSMSLYTIAFYNYYVDYIKPIILSANGRIKKILICDCDNTLWHGILGEDGFNGIQMSYNNEYGKIFSEIQHIVLSLMKKGVMLGLCSKNNPKDVDEVLLSHPDMILKEHHITIKKVNWKDKATNLRNIANDLNIGMESIVYMDDSDFEINLVRESLPQITSLKVPDNLHEYPMMLRENTRLFFQLTNTNEDINKHKQYHTQARRNKEKGRYNNLSDYLASLGLILKITIDNKKHISRLSQLTMKTNQFNITTKRYTELDIKKIINDNNFNIFAFHALDKFGDYGLTGLSIIEYDFKNMSCEIDSLLMSCRVIGRNLEYAFFDFIVTNLKNRGIKTIKSEYKETLKNILVKDLFENLQFSHIKSKKSSKLYFLELSEYKVNSLSKGISVIC